MAATIMSSASSWSWWCRSRSSSTRWPRASRRWPVSCATLPARAAAAARLARDVPISARPSTSNGARLHGRPAGPRSGTSALHRHSRQLGARLGCRARGCRHPVHHRGRHRRHPLRHRRDRGAHAARFVVRIGGEHQLGLLDVASQTIRGVAPGVIFTAFIQAILSRSAFSVVGAPGSTVLGFLAFFALGAAAPQLPRLAAGRDLARLSRRARRSPSFS